MKKACKWLMLLACFGSACSSLSDSGLIFSGGIQYCVGYEPVITSCDSSFSVWRVDCRMVLSGPWGGNWDCNAKSCNDPW